MMLSHVMFLPVELKIGDYIIYEEFNYPNTCKLSPPYSGFFKIINQLSEVKF